MNRYGALAMSHWQTWRPSAYAQIEDPSRFFTELGEQVELEIQAREDATRTAPPTGDYLSSVGHLNMTRQMAEEAVLAELVFLPAEQSTVEDPEMDQAPLVTRDGMPTDRDHPLWAMLDDPDVTTEEFKAALSAWWQTLPPSAR